MRIVAFALLLFTLPFAQPTARAQSTEAAIQARLKDQPLFLRGFWRDGDLHFDSSGQLEGHSDPVSFTLSGFELKKIALKPNQLVLTGPRIVLEFRNNKVKRVPTAKIKITIDAPPNGDYTQALDAVFANGLAKISPLLPYYWRNYATKNFLPPDIADIPDSSEPAPRPLNILENSGIIPPILRYSVEPKASKVAYGLGYSGTVLVNCWITPQGKVTHLSVARPVGAGLDEQAIAAVAQYTFTPAMQNGKPVLVELNVVVNFQLS